MARDKDGSGRMYTMVGLIASVAIPLAFIAPGLSKQVGDRETERLGPVEPEPAATEYRSELPDRARPVATGGADAPAFGQAGGFGAPMMNPGPTNAVSSDPLPLYEPPASNRRPNGQSSGQSNGASPERPAMRSQKDVDRAGAIAAGLPVAPTSRTVSHPAGKVNAPPPSTQKAPMVR